MTKSYEHNKITTYSILDSNKQEITDKWIDDLISNQNTAKDASKRNVLKEESKHLISLIVDVAKNKNVAKFKPRDIEPILKLLLTLSTSRTNLNYSPKDTAMYLFSLKKIFINFLKEHYQDQSGFDISSEISSFNNLLDIMGIFVLEEYSKKQISETTRKDEVIKYLSYQKGTTNTVDIIGNSPQMQNIFKYIGNIMDSDITVLIQGESGTGKEMIAQVIHYKGPRSQQPFIAINCGALPENLIESELFGHEKGAFTGATSNKLGKFELASDGTLFLDEIGEMPLNAQVKLLRALQNMEIQRVGGSETIKVNTRIIAATNKDLKDLVDQGKFREDLYYRLNIFPIDLPPIRERKEDIIPLATQFLNKYTSKYNKDITTFSDEAKMILSSYDWPGNVREIDNIIHRSVVLCITNTITEKELNISGNSTLMLNQPTNYDDSKRKIQPLTQTEKEAIQYTLEAFNGNIKKTAESLQISRTTLYSKLKEYNIDS